MGLLSGISETVSGKVRRGSNASTDGGGLSAPTSPRGSFSGGGHGGKGETPEGNKDDMEVLDKEEGNLLLSLVSQREYRSRRLSGDAFRGKTEMRGANSSRS